jgi:predicted esterase
VIASRVDHARGRASLATDRAGGEVTSADVRSPLVRRTSPPPELPGRGTIVALHDGGGQASDLVRLCHAVAPRLAVCAPQAPFSRNALLSSGISAADWGVYVGYSWYRHDVDGRPDPVSFGDALAALEELAVELRADDARGGLYLLGRGEGATIARAALRFFPELLDGVVALGGEPMPPWAATLAPDDARCVAPVLDDDAADPTTVARWFHERLREEETHGHA